MSEANKALVQRWFEEVWNKGRVEAIDELLAPSAVVHGLGEDLHGPEAFKPFHAAYRAAFPDMRICLEQLIAEGDLVAFRWRSVATHAGALMGEPPTGKQVQMTGMGVIRVANGDLVEGWNNFDQLGLLQQCGCTVAAPAQAV